MAFILGTPRDDERVGTLANDTIDGLAGNDILAGDFSHKNVFPAELLEGGDDLIRGGPSDDQLFGDGVSLFFEGEGGDFRWR